MCRKRFEQSRTVACAGHTAEHKSSTLQDIAAKKRTEIDALNGAVIKLAQKFKLAVPYNCTVYNLVKFIEAGKSNRG